MTGSARSQRHAAAVLVSAPVRVPVLAVVLTVALVLALAGTGAAAAAPGDTANELHESRRELESAQDSLADADERLEDAHAALEAVEADLAQSTAQLHELENELAAAEEAYEQARRRTELISARLREVDVEIGHLVGESTDSRDRLADSVASAYKHGGGARTGAMYGALLEAEDLHELSVGLRVVVETLEGNEQIAQSSQDLTMRAARARRAVAELRIERFRQEDVAQAALLEIDRLTRRQRQATTRIASDRKRKQDIIRATEQDREATAALVEELEATTARLAADLQRSVEVQWADIEVSGPIPDWAGALPAHGRQWAPAITQAAHAAGIDPRLFAALVWAESNFRPGARSHVGATGLAQLMPGTAAGLGVDPHDPVQNLAGGATYLARQLATFGRAELALAAYNAGPGAVQRYGGIPPYAETRFYVVRVLRYYEQIVGTGGA